MQSDLSITCWFYIIYIIYTIRSLWLILILETWKHDVRSWATAGMSKIIKQCCNMFRWNCFDENWLKSYWSTACDWPIYKEFNFSSRGILEVIVFPSRLFLISKWVIIIKSTTYLTTDWRMPLKTVGLMTLCIYVTVRIIKNDFYRLLLIIHYPPR